VGVIAAGTARKAWGVRDPLVGHGRIVQPDRRGLIWLHSSAGGHCLEVDLCSLPSAATGSWVWSEPAVCSADWRRFGPNLKLSGRPGEANRVGGVSLGQFNGDPLLYALPDHRRHQGPDSISLTEALVI